MMKLMIVIGILCTIISIGYTQEQQENHSQNQNIVDLNRSQIWGYGILTATGISLIGFLAALILVGIKKFFSDNTSQYIIKFLFSLACGALLGDTFIHILPEAYNISQKSKWIVPAILIGSLLFFLILERIFHSFGISHTHWAGQQQCQSQKNKSNLKVDNIIKIQELQGIKSLQKIKNQKQENGQPITMTQMIQNKEISSDSNQQKGCCSSLKGKQSSGYLNLLGSLIHNFVDGLAIGLGFSTGEKVVYIPIIIAIVAHQIPRQLGDVAILLKSNFSNTQTILCNGFVNLISIIGAVIGIAIVELDDNTKTYIMVSVAGNFLFVAADIWRNMLKNHLWAKNVVELFGFIVGVVAMFLILLLENQSQHHH